VEILDTQTTAGRLPYPALADSIREVALAMDSGDLHTLPRFALPLQEDGILLVMPACDQDIAITKLVTVHSDNPGHGLPTIQGEVVVMDAATGERLGLLEGGVVIARRTAALSMLAARELAPRPDGPLLVVGARSRGRPTSRPSARASASPGPSSLPEVRGAPYPSPDTPGPSAWKQSRSRASEKCSAT
jgi:1-piperideine-2-carboxylate/1-pyrroline-2-carboxylate reductase [NAD(P)H]